MNQECPAPPRERQRDKGYFRRPRAPRQRWPREPADGVPIELIRKPRPRADRLCRPGRACRAVLEHGNRLLGYTVYAWPNRRWRVTFPQYNGAGNPTRMLTERIMPVPGVPRFERTTFYHDTAQRLWMTLKETWDMDEQGHAVHCARQSFREFRYEGGGRGRYLTQTRDASPGGDFLAPRGDALWTDYDGDQPYVDYLVNAADGRPVNQRRYLPGLGHVDDATGASANAHGDPIGTLRLLTDGVTGATTLRRVYTAFGQPARSESAATTRYGYAGAWGYETGLDDGGEPDRPPLPFLHVGERWYDPAAGRFLQRDPIGILGGVNVYLYVEGRPAEEIDAWGLAGRTPPKGWICYGPSRTGWTRTGEGVYEWAFRIGGRGRVTHVYGVRGAACFGLAIGAAAGAGCIGSVAVEEATSAMTGKPLSEHIGVGLANSAPGFWGGDSVFARLFD